MTARTTSDAWKDVLIGLLAAPFLLFGAAAMSALPLMLGLGIVHAEITPAVPPLGFWATLGLSWALGALISKVRPFTSKRGA